MPVSLLISACPLISRNYERDFLYDTIGTYINHGKKANRSDLMWNTIKQERQRHLQMLRQALEKEAKEKKLNR